MPFSIRHFFLPTAVVLLCTFSVAQTFQTETFNSLVNNGVLASGDLLKGNGDDIVVADSGTDHLNSITYFFNHGSGGFRSFGSTTRTDSDLPISMVTSDLNNDGNLDVAISGALCGGFLTLDIGHGDGSFTSLPVNYQNETSPVSNFCGGSIGTINFNADTLHDLVIALTDGNHAWPDRFQILLNNGNNSFSWGPKVS